MASSSKPSIKKEYLLAGLGAGLVGVGAAAYYFIRKLSGSKTRKVLKPAGNTSKSYAAFEPNGELKPWEFELHPMDADYVEIKITHSGICHSDIHTFKGEWGSQIWPIVVGHEILGHVTQVGANVHKFKIGDRVGVGPQAFSCMKCDMCNNHHETYCRAGFLGSYGAKLPNGYVTKGGYAEYNRTHQRFVFKIPDNLDAAGTAPLLCAGVTTFTPLKQAGVKKGSKVAVIGIGGLGHIGIKFAAAMGAEVTAFSTSANKQKEAESFGAKHFVVMSAETLAKHKGTFDVVLNTVSADLPWTSLFPIAAPFGHFIQLGAPPSTINITPHHLVLNGFRLWGSLIGSPQDFEDMFALAAKHNITCTVETIPFSQVNEGIKKVEENKARYRMVLVMDEESKETKQEAKEAKEESKEAAPAPAAAPAAAPSPAPAAEASPAPAAAAEPAPVAPAPAAAPAEEAKADSQ